MVLAPGIREYRSSHATLWIPVQDGGYNEVIGKI